ncbi:MAG: hypothetical protein IH956_06000 [Chloroflexi bacterium]|nr:hypothetical protein [Chloroflexota bacterium]
MALDPLSLPEAAVPMDLGGARLPGDADSIVSLFNRLPGELAGRERTPRLDETGPSRFTAAYGQLTEDGCSSVRLQAVDLSSREFFPADWTADRFVAWWGLGADGDTVGQPPYTHSNLIPRLYHHRMTQILTPHTGSEFFKVSPSAPTGQIFETRQLTVQHFPPQWAHT